MMKKLGFSLTALAIALAGCGGDNNIEEVNTLPVVEAGEAQDVQERSFVTLSGTASDAEGEVTIVWEQMSGTSVDLDDTDTLTPSFRAPSTNDDETLVFRLTATDSNNESMSDEVSISVNDRTASSQGIDEDSNDRRDRANDNRRDDGDFVDNREVRTIDGSFNNETNTLWGASFTHLARWADVDYEDGISSMSGSSRPSARVVSNNIHDQEKGVTISNSFGTTDFYGSGDNL